MEFCSCVCLVLYFYFELTTFEQMFGENCFKQSYKLWATVLLYNTVGEAEERPYQRLFYESKFIVT